MARAGLVGEVLEELLDVLGAVLGADEDGLVGMDDDEVVDADCGDEVGFVRDENRTVRVELSDPADASIAAFIKGELSRQRVPRTDVIPVELAACGEEIVTEEVSDADHS